jgi:hypothetical protein
MNATNSHMVKDASKEDFNVKEDKLKFIGVASDSIEN